MGISTAPDEYQACMEKIFGDLPFVVVYLDDLLVFSKSEEEHLEHLRIVFERLEKYDVTLNGKKCHILRKSVDYLGFTLTEAGIHPQQKKIQAIQQIAVPKNRKELRRFLGMINYYRDMVPNKAALCARLNRFTSPKVPFTWLQSDTDAFHAVQKAFAEAVLLAFPDFELPFHVYADASGKQLGGIVMQQNQILACYSRTLNKHQLNYTTMELELLSIVELLREYRTMLLGFDVVVHTDHKNLIYPTETSLRVKRWKLLLAEYRLTLHYIQGARNVGADAFSRMRFEIAEQTSLMEEICATTEEPQCVMQGSVIRDHQEKDETLQKIKSACLAGKNNPDYKLMPLLGCTLVAYQGRVVIPESLRGDLIEWYHANLGHPGAERQFKTMRPILYWPGMEATIVKFVSTCVTCKRAKVHGGKQDYGLLPPRTLKTVNPWDVVHVDLIGPYDDGGYGITIIDQATRWLEVDVQPDKLALTTAESFDRVWLCRYPRPVKVVHDLGPEFTGEEFKEMLLSYGIKPKPITSKNPQANAICERVHLEIMNIVRCNEGVDWKKAIHYAAFAVRASYHSVLNASPGQLVFGEDMITRSLHEANWSYLSKRRFEAILADNDRENDKRIVHFYKPGDHVMLRTPKAFRPKTAAIATGPFTIKDVHDNGTVTLDKGATTQQVSIRRIFPC
jgi:cleavage and polyadenylation specificity factor subunit 1